MIGLVSLLFIGCLIVLLCALALFRMPNSEISKPQPIEFAVEKLIKLRASNFTNFSRLFSDADCRVLYSEPRLVRIAKYLRQDRRRLALRWLAALQSDVSSLWRLQRLLISYGVSEGAWRELVTIARVISILTFLAGLRLCVFVFGPFAFQGVASLSREPVETYTRFCRAALGRLPQARWSEFLTEWQRLRIVFES